MAKDTGGIFVMEKQKILIIDDDENINKTLSDILNMKGYDPFTAANGTNGLDLLKQFSINLVVIDLGLPDMPGLNVLEKVKTYNPFIEVIILTGNASLDSAIEATNKGAFSYLTKPYDLDQLLLHIRHALEKQEAQETIIRRNTELEKLNTMLSTANIELTNEIAERKQAEERLEESKKTLEGQNSKLEKAYADLRLAQMQSIQQEKMASIGQLASGMAHEINNPISFIISNMNTLQKYTDRITEFINAQSTALQELTKTELLHNDALERLSRLKKTMRPDFIMEDIPNIVIESLSGAYRIKNIVSDLKNFSLLDMPGRTPMDINKGLESAVNMLSNAIRKKVNLIKSYGDLPETYCDLRQLNQVFLNILQNAVQSIDGKGEIVIETRTDNDNIFIYISDTGCGIPPENINRIFEPFFTTKDVGQGIGLGLSIAYDIVKKHNGDIMVESNAETGTRFTIRIPVCGE